MKWIQLLIDSGYDHASSFNGFANGENCSLLQLQSFLLTQTFLFVQVFWLIFRHLFIQKHFIQLFMNFKQDNIN